MGSIVNYRKLALAALAVVALPAFAVPTVDGTADAEYGPAIVTQGIGTNFGNSNLGQPLFANGSELDGAYGRIDGGTLYLHFAGNLESNFNHLELFFNTSAGGQNQLRGDNADVDFNGLNKQAGLTFDAGFDADYYLTFGGGDTGGGQYQLFSNFATLPTGGSGVGTFVGGSAQGTGSASGALGISFAINNSNILGVGSGTGADSGAGVLTGLEVAIPLAALGLPAGDIHISAFINGGGHDFLANQTLGTLPVGTGNLGNPANVNFANIDGNQFFTIAAVPEPSSVALLALAGGVALRRRSR